MAATDEQLMREVATSLDATPELLPFLPELLADLWALGGQPALIVEAVRPLGLPPGARALDLGCGKGAVAVALAQHLGLRVLGVDAFPPFVEEARRRAEAKLLGERCIFRCADLRRALEEERGYDLALLVSVGPVLGGLAATVGGLRRCVRPGGYMVIDDAFLAEGRNVPVPRYEAYAEHEETLRRLTAHGDRLIREFLHPLEEETRINEEITERIRRRAARLAEEHPHAAELFRTYVAEQEKEAALEGEAVISALWVLERSG